MAAKEAGQVPDEINPMPPLTGLTGLAQEVFLDIMRTAEVLRKDLEELLKQSGLSSTQYNVLRILRGAGTGGCTCQEIIDRMVNRDPDMTRLLDRLEDRGLVTRARSQADRRVVRSYLTEEGLGMVEALDNPVANLHREQLGHLGEERLRALADSLRVLRQGLASDQ